MLKRVVSDPPVIGAGSDPRVAQIGALDSAEPRNIVSPGCPMPDRQSSMPTVKLPPRGPGQAWWFAVPMGR